MDLFETANRQPKEERYKFDTIISAHDWLDSNGWRPRHGGGYEKAGGYAVLKTEGGKYVITTQSRQ